MKVMILTDLEGCSGINGRADAQIGNSTLNPPTAQQALVNEVNACCEGLFAAGADEVVVLDGHGGSNSIDIFKLDPRASLLQVGELMPAAWVDASYDAMVQIGAHAMQSSGGYMCHTFNSHGTAEIRLNGKQIGEIGIIGYMGGYFHVPTILVSGDEAACKEAKEFFGEQVAVVPTKLGYNRYTAINYPTQSLYEKLKQTSKDALLRYKSIPACVPPESSQMLIREMCPNTADYYERLGIKRLDEVTLLFEGDFIEINAQRMGWAPGVHQRKYGITPQWRFQK